MPNTQMTPQECKEGLAEIKVRGERGILGYSGITMQQAKALTYALNLIQEHEELKTKHNAWENAFGTTQLTHAVDRLEVAERKVEQLQSQNKKLEEQIDELANFIMKDVGGEPSQNQGAVETAIRIIKSLQSQLSALKEENRGLKDAKK